ncbi:MAG: SulP family inorganic anion transporter [Flavobacteriales bacterium]
MSLFAHWKQDLPASVVVFLVALPLCLGIAVASGAPVFAGIIAGVVGGVLVGWLSGSPLGVTGPAAGLTGVVLVGIQELGSFEVLTAAVAVSGLVQIALGALRAGIIAYYFPSSVIKGMLAGIGVIIVLKQIPHLMGYDSDPMGDESFDQPDRLNTFTELLLAIQDPHWGAVIIAVVSIALMVLWERPFIRQNQWLRYVPGPLLAVVAGLLLAAGLSFVPTLAIGTGHYVDLPPLDDMALLRMPDLSAIGSPVFWTTVITLAIVASIETLLCVEATDKMDPWKRITPANRELFAQGAGNLVSGLLGGLPVTQVVVRSSANIQAGGRGKLAAILHGVLLLLAVLSIGGLLRKIPLASLAAILLLVGYKLAKPSLFVQMWKAGRMQFLPFLVTVGFMAVTNDLLRGVALGLALALVHILWKNYKVPFHYDPNRYKPGMPIYIELSEDVTFLNKAGIKRTLSQVPAGARVVIDAGRSLDLDPDVREIIDEFASTTRDRNIKLQLFNMPPRPGEVVEPVKSMLAEKDRA